MTDSTDVLLLVEDSEAEIHFFKEALRKTSIPLPLVVVSNGIDAVSYIEGSGRYSDRSRYPKPGLVLLDLKLPQKYGLEILEWLRRRPKADQVPVMVLTSSNQPEDIRKAYDLGAKAYLVKPIGMKMLLDLVQSIASYWQEPDESAQPLQKFSMPRPKGRS